VQDPSFVRDQIWSSPRSNLKQYESNETRLTLFIAYALKLKWYVERLQRVPWIDDKDIKRFLVNIVRRFIVDE